MGFFNRKKKSTPSPAVGFSPVMPDALPIPTVVAPVPPVISYLKLRVLIDRSQQGADADPTFFIQADPDAPATSIKALVEAKLGADVNAGCYKVAIPFTALEHARRYTQRFGTIVNFISVFPASNLHDPEQMPQVFCPGASCKREPLVRDWFPLGVDNSEGMISILARTVRGSSSSQPPLTLLAHLAPSPASCSLNPRSSPDLTNLRSSSSRRTPHCKASHAGSAQTRQLPIPIETFPSATIGDLKKAALAATGVSADADLEKVVAWQVDMTPEEMVVIEERGGLKHGQMPWPYPPTALVPVILNETVQPLSRYFSQSVSNTRNVSLSIWLHPTIISSDAAEAPPAFAYPMNFDELDDRLARTPSLGSARPSRSSRPSTAPAAVAGSVPAFGSTSRPRPTRSSTSSKVSTHRSRPSLSPLSTTSYSASDIVGLGIAVTVDHNRVNSNNSSYTMADSSDSGSDPVSSRCSSVGRLEPLLKTPRDELPSMLLTAQKSVNIDYFTNEEFA